MVNKNQNPLTDQVYRGTKVWNIDSNFIFIKKQIKR